MSNQARWAVLQSYNLLKWHRAAHRAAVKALESGESEVNAEILGRPMLVFMKPCTLIGYDITLVCVGRLFICWDLGLYLFISVFRYKRALTKVGILFLFVYGL